MKEMEQKEVHSINDESESLQNGALVTDRSVVIEIEEEENEENKHLDEDEELSLTDEIPKNHDPESLQNGPQVTEIVSEIEEEIEEGRDSHEDRSSTYEIPEKSHANGKRNVVISPVVEEALQTLERAFYMVREYGLSLSGLTNEKPINAGMARMGVIKDSTSSEDGVHADVEVSKKEIMEKSVQESRKSTGIQDSRHSGSSSYLREVSHNKIAPASPEEYLSNPGETNRADLNSSGNETMEFQFSSKQCTIISKRTPRQTTSMKIL